MNSIIENFKDVRFAALVDTTDAPMNSAGFTETKHYKVQHFPGLNL